MHNSKINYVAVGGFVLLVIVGLIASMMVLLGRAGPTDRYVAVFDNVTGIKYGTQVLFEGFPVGQVEDVSPTGEEGRPRFAVEVSVTEGWQIPADSRAQVFAAGFLSAKSIQINAGESEDLLSPGDRIPTASGGDMFALMAQVAGEVGTLSEDGLMPLLVKLSDMADRIGGPLAAAMPALTEDLQEVMTELSDTAPKLTGDLEAVVGELAKTAPRVVGNVERFSETLNDPRVDRIIANVDETAGNFLALSAQLRETGAGVDDILGRIDDTVTTVDGAVETNTEVLNQSLGDLRYTLAAVARHVDAIAHSLEGTSRNMQEFSRQIRENPGLLLGGSGPRDEPGVFPQ